MKPSSGVTGSKATLAQVVYKHRATSNAKEHTVQDLMTTISTLRRPRLLARAAKEGAQEYVRERHLQRILGYGSLPGSGAALMRLMELERDVNAQRLEDDSAYSLVRHLDLMIAIVGEARLFQASRAYRLE
ncbi:DUF6477 family protein [Ruegeria arenilitoris]|uniref:DUF6477 family protein n=1 Tax=Ruegeria arenilitoris TaxID=1173585 RepID=UPI003463BF28